MLGRHGGRPGGGRGYAMRKCLNLGCGNNPAISTSSETWTNLNDVSYPGVDVVRDIRRGLPFGDAAFDHVRLDNVLEHLASEDAIFCINEIDRVLAPGGTATIIVPHRDSQGAVQDPTHKSFYVPRSCLYWNQEQTPYGGTFVGITANLHAARVTLAGNMAEEAFLTFELEKRPVSHKVTP